MLQGARTMHTPAEGFGGNAETPPKARCDILNAKRSNGSR